MTSHSSRHRDPADGDEPYGDALRRALNQEASMVTPAGDGLGRIRDRIAAGESAPFWRRGWFLGVTSAAVATAATVAAVFAFTAGDDPLNRTDAPAATQPDSPASIGPTESAATEPAPTMDPTEEPGVGEPTDPGGSESPAAPVEDETFSVPVYYVGDTEGGPRLYREFRDGTGVDEPTAAVRAMLQTAPLDDDYFTAWPDGVDVESVSRSGGVITVNLTGPVQSANVGSELAEKTVQQLVYTVQAAYAVATGGSVTDPVQILVDGATPDLWGVVSTTDPIDRAPQAETQALIWVTTTDLDGTRLSVSGVSSTFEATVNWQLRDSSGTVIDDGFTTATAGNGTFGTYDFALDLPGCGQYTIEALEFSAADGSPLSVDDKPVTAC